MTVQTVHPEPAHLHEQFRNIAQQREAATLGMWTFLATEILFFGGLFVTYAIYRMRYPEDFRHGSLDLKWYLGGFNTAVLLLSSFFMALAVHASQRGENSRIVRYLLWTILLAVIFVGVKFTEYYIEYDEGLVPGYLFKMEEPKPSEESAFVRMLNKFEHAIQPASAETAGPRRGNNEQLFMCFYFIMTAIHATHMLVGIGLMIWLIFMARAKKFSAGWHIPVENIGLYWHFVDTVWVFLFPILYLLRNQ